MILVKGSKLKEYWKNYFLVLFSLILVLLFSYYPIFNGVKHIFYRWDGDAVEEFIGLGNITKLIHDAALWRSFKVLIIFILANFIKMCIPIITAVILHHVISNRWQYVYRVLFVIPRIVPVVVMILMWKFFYEPNHGLFNSIAHSTGLLAHGKKILWLSDPDLVIMSLVIRGFPWLQAFGVLLYLAGLQNIPREVYEAAEVDGAGPIQTFFHVELPLIMTQIRINLVLIIIPTIRGWQFVYLFLGEDGGPKGIATVPGLYIFRKSFSETFFGYGCAIGFFIFLITILFTWVNNKYVRVNR